MSTLKNLIALMQKKLEGKMKIRNVMEKQKESSASSSLHKNLRKCEKLASM